MLTHSRVAQIFQHIPEMETPRLRMRRIKVSDTDDMYAYSCIEEVTRYLLWSPHPSRDYTRQYLIRLQGLYRSGDFFDWGLEEKVSGKLIGTCGFTSIDPENNRAEVGYVLNPSVWGRGIAPEAVFAVLQFGFDRLSLMRIEARYMIPNERSRRVMEKCGMHFEGVARSAMRVKGVYRDIGTCSILRDEYRALPAEVKTALVTEQHRFRFASWI